MILTCRLVTLCWNGQYLPTYSIEAPDIADLSLQSSNKAPVRGYAARQSQPGNPTTSNRGPAQGYATHSSQSVNPQPRAPAQQTFVDPAILSFSKPQLGGLSSVPVHSSLQTQHREPPVSAALSEPFSDLELNVHDKTSRRHHISQEKELDGSVPVNLSPAKSTGKKTRRSAQNRPQRENRNERVPINEHDGASNMSPKTKGWRQTAFVEPSHQAMESPQPYRGNSSRLHDRRRKKKSQSRYAEDPNVWATEDATDIQEMGDFDFQSNLSKFDKRRVFEEIRNDDTTADESRLVSLNKMKPQPGTNGGKNLHWSENVLSPENSETDESDEVHSEEKVSSGNYSQRDRSRASARAQSSRKSSVILGKPSDPPLINSIGRGQLNSPSASSGSLRLTTTNRSCPTVSPLQALEVEQIAVAEFGLTEDIVAENAGRGIAEGAIGLLPLPNDSAARSMLVLTGNHRTGARAIAAARHLRNRGHRVTVCMVGLEHEMLESCRKQLAVFRKIGGRILGWEELATRLSASEFSPDLVVDALFGMHLAFEDLRTDDQGTVFEMISWVNRSNIAVLSVDVPSGVSASSGKDLIRGPLCSLLINYIFR